MKSFEPIGKGGMDEVFRAKDGTLGRDVAIKFLPEEFARDAEGLALYLTGDPEIAGVYVGSLDCQPPVRVLEGS